jgi:predicted nucleotide-binding protein
MPKRPATPEIVSANLTPDQIRKAIPRIRKRIDDLNAFNPKEVERGGPEVSGLRASIEQTLRDVFGADTHEFNQYRRAASFTGGPISMSSSWASARLNRGSGADYQFRQYYAEERDRAVALLMQAIQGLEEQLEYHQPEQTAFAAVEPSRQAPIASRKIFIVHGHDEAPRESVARFLEKIGFEPIILHERPNKGRTLIAKLREEAQEIGFAVVLMTPDDAGGKLEGPYEPRARQNVIFELGFFIGALGPERVAPLIGAGVERPSDYEGVVYIPIDSEWKTALANELQAAGYEIDWNLVMKK